MAILSNAPDTDDITTLTPAAGLGALASYRLDAVLGFDAADDFFGIEAFAGSDSDGVVDYSEISRPFSMGESAVPSTLRAEVLMAGGADFPGVAVPVG